MKKCPLENIFILFGEKSDKFEIISHIHFPKNKLKSLTHLSCLAMSVQQASSGLKAKVGFLSAFSSSRVPFQARKTFAFLPNIRRERIFLMPTFTTEQELAFRDGTVL